MWSYGYPHLHSIHIMNILALLIAVLNFVPAERQEVRKQVTDPIVAKRTRDYYRNLGKVQITGWAKCYLEPIPSIA